MKIDLRLPIAALAAIALLTVAPVSAQTSAPVSVLYAGSLVTPMEGASLFYPRLAQLSRPALFVWGTHDRLIPPAFGRHVRKWLPSAEQVTIQRCGHVPQVERPEETNELLMRFFARADAGAPGRLSGGLDAEAA